MTTIAIIEDDQVINQMYRMKFEAAGFDVVTASDGETGVKVVQHANPDIILAPAELRNLGIHSYIVKANLTPSQVVIHAKEALNDKR